MNHDEKTAQRSLFRTKALTEMDTVIQLERLNTDHLPSVRSGANIVFRHHGGDMSLDYPVLWSGMPETVWFGAVESRTVVSAVGTIKKQIATPFGRISAAGIGSVYTLPDYRERGLASQLLDLSLAHLREEGVELVLISGDLSIYRRVGAVLTGCFLYSEFSTQHIDSPSGHTAIVEYSAEMATQILCLYDQKIARFERNLQTWNLFVGSGKAEDKPCRIFAGIQDGYPQAYVVSRSGGDGVFEIVESSGPFELIYKMLPEVGRQWNSHLVRFFGDSPDDDVATGLSQRSIRVDYHPFAGTMLALQPKRLWERFKMWAEDRNPAANCRFWSSWDDNHTLRIRVDNTETELSTPGEISDLLFGSKSLEIEKPISNALAPFLPVPLPRYGMDFT